MLDLISSHIDALITAIIGGASGWFFTRKQKEAETKITEGSALEGIQRAYDRLVEDMNQKFSELKKENAELKEEIQKLHNENAELKKMLTRL